MKCNEINLYETELSLFVQEQTITDYLLKDNSGSVSSVPLCFNHQKYFMKIHFT